MLVPPLLQQATRQQYGQAAGAQKAQQGVTVSGAEASAAPQQGAPIPQMPYANPAAMASYGMNPYAGYMYGQYPAYMPNPYGYPQVRLGSMEAWDKWPCGASVKKGTGWVRQTECWNVGHWVSGLLLLRCLGMQLS